MQIQSGSKNKSDSHKPTHTRNKNMETVVMQTYMSMCIVSAPGMKLNMPMQTKMKTYTEKKQVKATQTQSKNKNKHTLHDVAFRAPSND